MYSVQNLVLTVAKHSQEKYTLQGSVRVQWKSVIVISDSWRNTWGIDTSMCHYHFQLYIGSRICSRMKSFFWSSDSSHDEEKRTWHAAAIDGHILNSVIYHPFVEMRLDISEPAKHNHISCQKWQRQTVELRKKPEINRLIIVDPVLIEKLNLLRQSL
jgi:hypothetical protein